MNRASMNTRASAIFHFNRINILHLTGARDQLLNLPLAIRQDLSNIHRECFNKYKSSVITIK